MKSILIYKVVIGLLFLLFSCGMEDESADEFLMDPIGHVFHDAIEVEVEDTLSQLAIDVKIVGWKKSDRDEYLLHYTFSPKNSEVKDAVEDIVPYTKIRIKEDVLTESLLFTDLDSATEYTLELVSTYDEEYSSTDTYTFSTKGDTLQIDEEEME